jgi:glycosyltransferase involved in cell wall biosynthesis
MKILQIHNYFKLYGGEDKVVENERDLLEENGDTVIPFYIHNKVIDQFNVFQKILFFFNFISNRALLKSLFSIIKTHKPDVAHVHNIYPLISGGVYEFLVKNGVPVVQTIHDNRLALLCPQGNGYIHDHLCTKCYGGNFLNCVRSRCVRNSLPLSIIYALALSLNRVKKISIRNITKTIYLSDHMFNHLKSIGFQQNKMVKKPHFFPDSIEPTFRYEKYFVFLGAVSHHKGILMLAETYKKIKTDYILKIIGTGDCVEELKAIIKDHSNIEYIGFLSGMDRIDILKNAYCTISPSVFFETFGMTVLESLSCAVPVIASNVGAFPELVLHGKTGLLFEPGDSLQLKERIEALISDPDLCRRLGKNGYDYYKSNFTKEINYSLLKGIYKDAISETNPRENSASC